MSTSHPNLEARRIAVVILACRDFAALELALASQMAYRPPGVPFYVLQNCRGGYDAERTLGVAKRYERLFPGVVNVVDDIVPGDPYKSIKKLLSKPEFKNIDLVCKVDDDAFPIAPDWLEQMVDAYDTAEQGTGRKLGYVTPLINNNAWGFPQLMKAMDIEKEYFSTQAHPHFVGSGNTGRFPLRIIPAEQIETGTNGTIWGYPHIARWLHERTTLQPDAFINATQSLEQCDVPSQSRYSIGCVLFRKPLWDAIDDGGRDDEHMMHMHCERNDLRIVCVRRVPFVHLAYFTQREENRDIVDTALALYAPRFGHPFPLVLYADRERENEARLRWLEERMNAPATEPKQEWLRKLTPKRIKGAVRRRLVSLWPARNTRGVPGQLR